VCVPHAVVFRAHPGLHPLEAKVHGGILGRAKAAALGALDVGRQEVVELDRGDEA